MKTFLSAAGFSLLALASNHAATIVQTANDGSSNLWSTDGGPWGGTAPTAGNDYFTAPGLMAATGSGVNYTVSGRIRDTGSVFGGDTITIVDQTQLMLKGGNNSITTGNIILDGGMVVWAVAQTGTTSLAGTLAVPSTGLIGMGSANTIDIASTLTGSGILSLRASDGTPTITFSGDLSGFNGTFQIGGGEAGFVNVDFNQEFNLSASIAMGTFGSTLDILNLDQAITVNSFTFGTTTLAPDTYTVDQLNSLVGNGAQFTGTGTLTTMSAVPEPSAFALGALGTLYILIRRRSK